MIQTVNAVLSRHLYFTTLEKFTEFVKTCIRIKEGAHMDYKKKIVEMIQKIDDERILSFIYRIISNLRE